jgi:hypothetical protein
MNDVLELETAAAAAAKPEIAPSPLEQIFQLLVGKHITYSLTAVARLEVADHMSRTPKSVDQLAQIVAYSHRPDEFALLHH